MNVRIEPSWKDKLALEFEKPYFKRLTDYVKEAYRSGTIYPAAKNIFRAFDLSTFSNTKVVILGQDPYHGPGQADGLAFSVPVGISFPPSLRNIFAELEADIGIPKPISGSLDHWAKQGVLLLNATLTVAAHQAGSHQNQGWEHFTNAVIEAIAKGKQQVVFMLWGSYAGQKAGLIDGGQHLILKSAHPSPLSAHRGFFQNRHFSKANDYLVATGQAPIVW
ncbi:MAG: uracil-DNA glycosylase [Candidatus Cardinium sp.]|uniref:uracil-DNA glycosylase n=1 Tax=Cardinium endosymbiont of Dermatophagoides farinae TaxID=2597823 RepID=UPI0011824168|nr:uracil-DNA glycosylase [Cardinium endosymbiont of Dermatophagoides farinae]TSJ81338.1 uracil-DNA glycosylase [Cardinium endosymbiont of Dermatophagoides farinae]UWW97401.1 MAG: uracil-DNA glycosylase [Candidatus Cardinium sp.]